MARIDAVFVDPAAVGHVAVGKTDPPLPRSNEALIRVHTTSINRGEIRRASTGTPGQRIGWDFAGVVEQAAEGGLGPKAGTRVVGMLQTGAWAEQIAVPIENVAVLPADVDFRSASTLPIAGLTALYGLDRAPGLVARRVLVTGGTGGVGYFAIQLAKLGGAHVIASVRREEQTGVVRAAGADEVLVGDAPAPAVDFVLDGVGGSVLSSALARLAKNGSAVIYGSTAAEELTLAVRSFYPIGGASVYGFILFHELGSHPAGLGLSRLVSLVAARRMATPIEVEGSLTEIGSIAQKLMNRAFTGKAVIHFR